MKVLVTGAAGFIGYHVARRLAESKRCEVLGVDNLGDYYDVALKQARLAELAKISERVEAKGRGPAAEETRASDRGLEAVMNLAAVTRLGWEHTW